MFALQMRATFPFKSHSGDTMLVLMATMMDRFLLFVEQEFPTTMERA